MLALLPSIICRSWRSPNQPTPPPPPQVTDYDSPKYGLCQCSEESAKNSRRLIGMTTIGVPVYFDCVVPGERRPAHCPPPQFTSQPHPPTAA
jgi:hypothetical protein